PAAVDVIVDARLLDGLAKEVPRLYIKLHLLTGLYVFLWRSDGDLVFGFLVFLYFKRSRSLTALSTRNDSIAAERRSIRYVDFSRECPAVRQPHFLFEDLASVCVFNGDRERAGHYLIAALALLAQEPSEIDLLRGTIDRTIGVDVAGQPGA